MIKHKKYIDPALPEDLIKKLTGAEIRYNVNMSSYSPYNIGGIAKAVVMPETCDKLAEIMSSLINYKQNYFILGRGSSVVVSEKGYDGVVILTHKLNNLYRLGDCIVAEGGCEIKDAVKMAASRRLRGLEFAAAMSGTVGGAVAVNSGAFGSHFSDILEAVEIVDEKGETIAVQGNDLNFTKSSSIIKNKKLAVLQVIFRLKKGNKEKIIQATERYYNINKQKTLKNTKNISGVFRRHSSGKNAMSFINKCGLDGYSVGGASLSRQYENCIILNDGATAQDIYDIVHTIVFKVSKKINIAINNDLIFIGKYDKSKDYCNV